MAYWACVRERWINRCASTQPPYTRALRLLTRTFGGCDLWVGPGSPVRFGLRFQFCRFRLVRRFNRFGSKRFGFPVLGPVLRLPVTYSHYTGFIASSSSDAECSCNAYHNCSAAHNSNSDTLGGRRCFHDA